MATRDDIFVDFLESPRIIEVAAPSTEVTMQDLVDTVRKIEDGFSKGMPHDKLLDASGKEDLGGGVLVGITADLQNAQLSFDGRTAPAETGTVTTGSGTPINGPTGQTYNFIDTAADFVTAGIERGSLVINFTDNSVADVIEVVSATELKTRVLINGTDNEWDVGDVYHIYNIVQCNATGGNLVAVDSIGSRITSVFPTAFVQVVRTASSSATLQEQADIQYASFGGGVTIDQSSSYSGTLFPVGTPRQPVNNFVDALNIASERGFRTLFIIGNATFNSGLDFTGLNIVGESQNKSTFIIESSANVTNSEFSFATIEGTLDGGNVLVECSLQELSYVDGFIERCILNDTITLSGLETAHFLDCFSGIVGLSTPTIDLGGSGAGLALRNYNGGILLKNKNGVEDVSIDLNSGQVLIEDTVTNGDIVLRGVGRWGNSSTYTGGANIVDQLVKVDDVQQTAFNNTVAIDVNNGTAGTDYPLGTIGSPVDNINDAVTIANTRGIKTFFVIGSLSIGTEADWTDWTFKGQNPLSTMLTFSALATTDEIDVENCKVFGSISGTNILIENALLGDGLSISSGLIRRSGFTGTLSLIGPNTVSVRFHDCYGAADPGGTQPIIDGGGDGPLITLAGYIGAITLQNKTGTTSAGFGMSGGLLTLDNTTTNGTIICSGLCRFTDNSNGATVIDYTNKDTIDAIQELKNTQIDGRTFEAIQQILLSMAQGRIVESATGVFDFYEQDNTTISFTLTKSGNERTRS